MAKNGSFRIEVKNADRLAVKFGKMGAKAALAVRHATKNRTFEIERIAKQRTPVDTGHLRRNNRSSFTNGGFSGMVRNNVFYAIYVEKGTRYMRAQPFLFPAFLIGRRNYIQDLQGILKQVTK